MRRHCPYPGISEYLGREDPAAMEIPGARITHVWTDDPADAPKVAEAARIPHVARHPEEVIGQVDAVLVATDIGGEHVARCRPFVEAGLPVFVDKPLVDNAADLAVFRQWVADGRPILSSSCMRYAREFEPYRRSTQDLGSLRYVSATTHKSWDRYGIHALEAVYPIVGPGFRSVRHTGDDRRAIVHLRHGADVEVVIAACDDMVGGFGTLLLCGTAGSAFARFSDTYHAFREQLVSFVDFVRTGVRPFPFAETDELMRLVIAGIRSRAEGGAEIAVTAREEEI
jgi:predicted dehydrogenase